MNRPPPFRAGLSHMAGPCRGSPLPACSRNRVYPISAKYVLAEVGNIRLRRRGRNRRPKAFGFVSTLGAGAELWRSEVG
jgi:hypothetical protein